MDEYNYKEEKKPAKRNLFAGFIGFVLGTGLPGGAAFATFSAVFPWPYTLKLTFFACLLAAGVLAGIGGRFWGKSSFFRGLTIGACLWLAALPFIWNQFLR
ncbi:MAG: hypothetical protein QM758_29730 [Armatimonas sp.]